MGVAIFERGAVERFQAGLATSPAPEPFEASEIGSFATEAEEACRAVASLLGA